MLWCVFIMPRKELEKSVKDFTLRELNEQYQFAKNNNNKQDIKIINSEMKRRRNSRTT